MNKEGFSGIQKKICRNCAKVLNKGRCVLFLSGHYPEQEKNGSRLGDGEDHSCDGCVKPDSSVCHLQGLHQ